jgi:hypothetical protein
MIDLRECKTGDKLGSKYGAVVTYVKFIPDSTHPHRVRYPNGDLRDLAFSDGENFNRHVPYKCEPDYKFLIW